MAFRVGFGVAPITPEVPVRLAGFGARTQPAESVHDDLEARAVLLSDGATTLCLVVCDLLGMTEDFTAPAREAIAAELGVPSPAVLTACTHTHSGPSALRGSDALGWTIPEDYERVVAHGCLTAARAAGASARPARLRYVRAPLPAGLSVNRRGHPYDDPALAVLEASADDGTPVGVVANVAIHPVTLGPGWLEVSADWPGTFRRAWESAHGGRAVLLSGALGDVNPWPAASHDLERMPRAESLGTAIASAATEALDGARTVDGRLAVASHRTLEVPIAGSPLSALASYGDTMPVELVEWDIGDVRLVTLPGEAFHAFGKKVAAARSGRDLLLAGLSPLWQGYLPEPFGDGYEEGVSFGRRAVQEILDALTRP